MDGHSLHDHHHVMTHHHGHDYGAHHYHGRVHRDHHSGVRVSHGHHSAVHNVPYGHHSAVHHDVHRDYHGSVYHGAGHYDGHHDHLSTAQSVGIGAGIAASFAMCGFAVWRVMAPWSLRDSSTQIPDSDLTPTGRTPTGLLGETGDPTEFLSVTPTGRFKSNARARFF